MSRAVTDLDGRIRAWRPGLALALALVLQACGQTGPLTLPNRSAASETAAAETGQETTTDDDESSEDER